MAIVRFIGERVRADPIESRGHGWLMRSFEHTARLVPGTEFFVPNDDVVTMTPTPGLPHTTGQAELEAAMAAERETLPTPAQVIRANSPIAHDAPGKV